ncbi:EamA family transporter [Massilia brevitalea]|uniref:EamA family transporter n=1 Tax=Massilia brevitalea TaxID=442526 RepID=UPI0027399650|nr:EamA family transporter [Massilia brevitalea]
MSGTGVGMSGTVAMAVLAAALMHAAWNAMLKTKGDAFLSTVAVAVSAGLLCALALPWLPQPAPASWPCIAASALIHVLYYALLMATYRDGDVSLAYPLMRGCAPLIVASFGLAFMGERLGAMQWLSICLICGGVLAMTGRARANTATSRRTTLLALASAATIAAYTLVDGAGVRLSDAPAAYTMWIFAATAPGVAALAVRRRRELLPFVRSNPALPGGGALSVGAYWVALWAMTQAPVAAVAALRETSILFATAIAVFVLRERVAPPRLAGAVLIACGAAAMRLG